MNSVTLNLGGRIGPGFALAALFGLTMCLFARAANDQPGDVLAQQEVLTSQQGQRLSEPGRTIRIGVTSIPPQVFRDPLSGRLSGLCIDFIRELQQVSAIRFEVVYYDTWNEMMGAAFLRDIDVIYAAQKTPSREAAFLFTEPYLRFENKIVTTEDVEGPLTLDDLSGKTVTVVAGAAIEEYLRLNYPDIELLGVDDELIGLTRVSFNQADAMVIEIARASWYIQQNKFTNLHLAGDAGYVFELGFACRNDQPELTAILNAGLEQISEQRRNELINRWILPTDRRGPDLKILLIVAGGFVFALLAVFGWNRLLSFQVRHRTQELERELNAHQKDTAKLRRYETIISVSGDQMVFIDADGVFRAANGAYLKAVGKCREEVVGRKVEDVLGHSFFESHVRDRLEEALRGKTVEFESWFYLDLLGEERYLKGTYYPHETVEGVIEGAVLVVHDLTDVQLARQTIQDSEKQLRSLFLASPVGMGRLKDRVFISVNERVCQITGYLADELIGQNARMLYLCEEDYHYVGIEKYRQIEDKGIGTVETRWRCKDGSVIDVLLSSAPMDRTNRENGVSFTVMDITERKTAQKALDENRQALERLFGNLRGIAYRCAFSPDWTMEFISSGCEELTGYSPRDFYDGKALWGTMICGQDQVRVWEEISESITDNKTFQVEYRVRIRNGEIKWFWEKGCGVFDEAGQVAAVEGFITDITDRRRAEDALRESEKKYRTLVDQAAEMLFLHDMEGALIDVNQVSVQATGYSREELLEMNVHDIDPDAKLREDQKEIWGNLKRGGAKTFEVRHRRKDGTFYWAEVRAGKLLLEGREYVLALANDITERKASEEAREQLLRELRGKNEELESIVFIASHDLRSPLVNIQGFTGELEKSLAEVVNHLRAADLSDQVHRKLEIALEEDIPESLRFVKNSSQKMESLLNGLLRLSRIGTAQVNPIAVNMNQLVGGIIGGLGFKIREYHIDISADGDLPGCLGDITLINQVFSNLIDNAIKYRHPERSCRIRIRGFQEDGMSVYQVEDNGIGIPDEHKNKVFEIFHQLNPGSGGDGLGLTIVRRVLERQRGMIQIDSGVGEGTRITVTLPKA